MEEKNEMINEEVAQMNDNIAEESKSVENERERSANVIKTNLLSALENASIWLPTFIKNGEGENINAILGIMQTIEKIGENLKNITL